MLNPSESVQIPGKPANHVCALLLVLFLLCGGLAIHYKRLANRLQSNLDATQASLRTEASKPSDQFVTSPEKTPVSTQSGRVFEMVNLLSQKEKVITELRQRIIALQNGRIPEAGLSTNTLPRSMRRTVRARKPVEQPAEPPPRAPVAPQVEQELTFADLPAKVAFFKALDVSTMPVEEQRTHYSLVKHLESLRKLTDDLGGRRGAGGISELRALILRESKAVQELMPKEKRSLLCNMGRELGYDDESSQWFSEYVDQVDSMTAFSPSITYVPATGTALQGESAQESETPPSPQIPGDE